MISKNSTFRRFYCNLAPQIHLYQHTYTSSYDHLISLCLRQCRIIKGRYVFDEMPHRISQALRTCRVIHGRSLRLGFPLDEELGNAVLDLYAKCGYSRYSVLVFQRLENRDVQSWNSFMSMHLRSGMLYEVGKLFRSMQISGIMPNPYSYAIVLAACAKLKLYQFGKQVHCNVIKTGCLFHSFCEGSLTDMYVKCDSLIDAKRMFDQLESPSLVSWTVIIAAYVQIGLLDEAFEVFEKMRKFGCVPDQVAFMTMISAFMNDGRLNEARNLFSQMPCPNSLSWNVMISGHAKKGYEVEAIQLFLNMRKAGVPSTRSTLGSVISAIASLKVLDVGMSVHAQAIKQGLDRNVYVGSSLINMCAKCQKLDSARQVFDSIDERNIVLWNAMLGGYVQNGFAREVVELFIKMKDNGFHADEFTYTSILSACGGLERQDLGSQLHCVIIKTNFESNLFVANALVDMYAKSRSLVEARKLFDRINNRDNVSWNAIIVGYVQGEDENEAFGLFQRMMSHGTITDEVSLASILSACANLKDLDKGRQIHCLSVKRGLSTSLYVGSSLIDMYVKCGLIKVASEIFNRMSKLSVISLNALISGIAQDNLEEALNLYKLLVNKGLTPSDITFANLLDACRGPFDLSLGRQIHCHVMKQGILYNDGILGVSLLCMYMNLLKTEDAGKLFWEYPKEKSVVLWTSMISGLNQNGSHEEALKFYHEMRLSDVMPDQATFASILKACSVSTSLRDGTGIHSFVVLTGYNSDILVNCALIDMYAKCGDVKSSMQVFAELEHRHDVIAWNSVIVGLAKNGYVDEVLKLFDEMLLSSINPDDVTFLGILGACSHGGKISEGRHFYNMMVKEFNILPRNDHCACLIDLYGRWGLLEEAQGFIENLGFEPDSKIWASFLGACRLHGDDERGRIAAERLIKLDPHNSSAYVLLSSIHASSGNWGEVGVLRKQMREKGVPKFPGSSWISRTKDKSHYLQ
ncbi:pentatricopeptide repeat-containing protein At3g09040, mitochondrial isoform X1 [Silene latifolia]|uniref:pentatricopeptide repeat-containing protein At3g09040, mitochondrial isoform X1 n=2 Tax=Silene latifolia TaxID=37657 RepID=UPI003D786AD3